MSLSRESSKRSFCHLGIAEWHGFFAQQRHGQISSFFTGLLLPSFLHRPPELMDTAHHTTVSARLSTTFCTLRYQMISVKTRSTQEAGHICRSKLLLVGIVMLLTLLLVWHQQSQSVASLLISILQPTPFDFFLHVSAAVFCCYPLFCFSFSRK